MKCPILTEERWQQLLDDSLTGEEASELSAHLSSSCPSCERFFLQMDEGERERLQTALQWLSSPKPFPADSNKFFRTILEEVRRVQGLSARRRRPRSLWRDWPRAPVWAGAMAVFILVVIASLIEWKPSGPPLLNKKGPVVSSPTLQLEFSIGHREPGGRLIVSRGVVGAAYHPLDQLFLRFEVSAEGYVYHIGYPTDGRAELLVGEGRKVEPSEPYMEAVSLENIRGRYAVVSVYSPEPLDPYQALVPVVQRSVDPRSGSVDREAFTKLGEGVTMEAVYFDVHSS